MFAIPTIYKDIQFRSRLEAKWARLFDLLKLPWLYESKDLNYYNPDFIVGGELLAEVKGCSNPTALQEHVAKIEQSGWKGPWVLLGEHPSIQLGHRIKVPNAEALWAEVCNATRWFARKQPEYGEQKPVFETKQFQPSVTVATKVETPILTLPDLPTYRLPTTPTSIATPPQLPR